MGPTTPYELKLCQADLSQAYVYNPLTKTVLQCRREGTTSLSDVGSSIGYQFSKIKYEFLTGPVEGAVFYLLLLMGALIWGWVCIRSVGR